MIIMKKALFIFIVFLLSHNVATGQEMMTIDGIQYVIDFDENVSYVLGPEDMSITTAEIQSSVTYNGNTYNVVELLNNCFAECKSLSNVVIPSSVTKIGEKCFQGCSSIVSIEIPNSISYLPVNCFASCYRLVDIQIPTSVGEIKSGCFINCTSLSSINLPNGLRSLGGYCFDRCSELTEISIPESVTSIGNGCFNECSKLQSVNIPKSITNIEDYTFQNCKSLSAIELPPSLTEIGNYAFSSCKSLQAIELPKTVGSIGEWAFAYCSSLKTIEIPASITQIGVFCFISCISMTDATIHSSAELLGTFGWCNKLYKVICDASSVPLINTSCSPQTFDGTQFNSIGFLYVPADLINAYKEDEYWNKWANIKAIDNSGIEPEPQKCATPTISFVNGEVEFSCETEGVEYVSEVTVDDAKKNYTNKVNLSGIYKVSVYATKEGYENSDVATLEFSMSDTGLKGDVNGDGVVDVSDYIGVANIILTGNIYGNSNQSRVSRHGEIEK